VVGTPLSKVDAGVKHTLVQGSLLFFAVLLFAAALAAVLGARLHSAINALVAASQPGAAGAMKRSGISEIDFVGDVLRKAFHAKDESERRQQMLIGELNHRVKNMLSVVQSLAYQTFRGDAPPKAAISAFEGRLQALAAAHNLLTEQRWESASMLQIVKLALAPFCDVGRCEVDGPDVSLSPQRAVSLALAVHELATNATKYGALSRDTGRVLVSWTVDGADFELTWREEGGPPARPPKAEGFGMRLIRRSLAAELRGAVEVEFADSGIRYQIEGKLA
jgi:two-component sensor histidine kinase